MMRPRERSVQKFNCSNVRLCFDFVKQKVTSLAKVEMGWLIVKNQPAAHDAVVVVNDRTQKAGRISLTARLENTLLASTVPEPLQLQNSNRCVAILLVLIPERSWLIHIVAEMLLLRTRRLHSCPS
jgi:hypothetical protein